MGLDHVGLQRRCSQIATWDVTMDKSKYFYEFVKFGVGGLWQSTRGNSG